MSSKDTTSKTRLDHSQSSIKLSNQIRKMDVSKPLSDQIVEGGSLCASSIAYRNLDLD